MLDDNPQNDLFYFIYLFLPSTAQYIYKYLVNLVRNRKWLNTHTYHECEQYALSNAPTQPFMHFDKRNQNIKLK